MPRDSRDSSFDDVLRRAQAGDGDAFAALCEPHRAALTASAECGLDRRLRGLYAAGDVVQETLTRAFRDLSGGAFHAEAGFRAWLARIQRNLLIDLARRHLTTKKRMPFVASLDGEIGHTESGRQVCLGALVAGPTETPSRQARRREAHSALEALLQGLRPEAREVLMMAKIEKVPTADIAARLGKSVDAVRKSIQRAVEECRALVKRHGLDVETGEEGR